MKIYSYSDSLSAALICMMDDLGWTVRDLSVYLRLPVTTVIRLINGAGKVSEEERSAIMRKFPRVSWYVLSGEEEDCIREKTAALMRRMKERTFWGRIKKWFSL